MREGGEGSRGGGSGSSWGKKCSGFNLGNKEQMDGTLVQYNVTWPVYQIFSLPGTINQYKEFSCVCVCVYVSTLRK